MVLSINVSHSCIHYSKWSLDDIIIWHRFESFYWGYAQFKYYLPEYQNVLI